MNFCTIGWLDLTLSCASLISDTFDGIHTGELVSCHWQVNVIIYAGICVDQLIAGNGNCVIINEKCSITNNNHIGCPFKSAVNRFPKLLGFPRLQSWANSYTSCTILESEPV